MKTVFSEHDMVCPKCGHDEQLDVSAQIWVRLVPDGTTDAKAGGDQEWGSESACVCRTCGYGSTVSAFRLEEHEFLFDVALRAAFRFKAKNFVEARHALIEALDCASINAGEINGQTLSGEASIRGEPDLEEMDGERP